MAIPTGNIDFNVIDIGPQNVAAAFQSFLDRGSKSAGVALDDLDLGVVSMPTSTANATLSDLLRVGMKLFDAVVWITAGRPASHALRVDPAKTTDTIPTLAMIADAVIFTFFTLVTQARYPHAGGAGAAPPVSNFLTEVMGHREAQSVYIRRLCSFAPEKFDQKWIKYVSFDNFGQEIMSRFGLGVAGYRMFAPFKLYAPKESIPAGLITACAFARNVATADPSWAVHPSTRDPAILTRRGNLNKNLGNLILDVFTDEQIAEMIQTKVLFARPARFASHRNYLTWTAEDDITGTDFVFR